MFSLAFLVVILTLLLTGTVGAWALLPVCTGGFSVVSLLGVTVTITLICVGVMPWWYVFFWLGGTVVTIFDTALEKY